MGWLRACLVLGLLLGACFAERPVARLERAALSIRRVQAFEAPSSEQARVALIPGDFVLSGNGLRVVVGGLSRRLESRGVVLEASSEGVPAAESIVLLAPSAYVRGVSRPVRVERIFIGERAKQPMLRIEGAVLVQERAIGWTRELNLGRVPGTLSISTRLETLRPEGEGDVRVGARIAWGGPHPFMPGLGVIEDQSFHRGELLGAEGATGSSTFGFADSRLSARAQYEDSSHGKALLYTDVVALGSHDLKRGKPVYVRSILAVAAGGLSVSARRFGFARARPFREVWALVPYHPVGAEVLLTDGAGQALMTARPDAEGRVVLPVVPVEGRIPSPMFVVASAYGHAASERLLVTLDPAQPASVLTIPRGGQVRLRARDAVTGEPIAVRARFVSLEDTAKLALGPDYRASGAGDSVVVLHGEADVGVPAGRYHVIVTHGPEWSLLETVVDVTETYSPLIQAVLRHEVDPGDWLAGDLHVHAEPSPDSEVSLDDRLASLEAEGISFVVPTDHDLVTDYAAAAQGLGLEDLRSVPGVEITTADPILGHFNAYPMPRDLARPGNGAPDPVNVQPEKLFQMLHALDPDLMVQVNHPRLEGGIGYFDVMSLDPATGAADPRYSAAFDAMEVWNGFDLARPEKFELVFRDWLLLLARGQRVVATGSSDSHQVRYQLAGYPRTYIQVPAADSQNPRAVVRALKAGRAFVSSGPFLEVHIGAAGPGATVSVPGGHVALEIRVRVPQWMSVERLEVFVGAECVLDQPLAKAAKTPKSGRNGAARPQASRLEQTVELELSADDFVVVRVSGTTPLDDFFGRKAILPVAFTNPIFVDVDGDARTVWSR